MIKDIPISERPRERALESGVSSLSDSELLAIILRCGTKDKSVKEISYELLNKFGPLENFKDLTINKLMEVKGIGRVKAIEVMSVLELSKRIYSPHSKQEIKLRTSYDIYENFRYLFDNSKQELFYCLYLNNKNVVIERKLLFMGTINKSIVHPREIFKNAYLTSATSIICIHNHPSGDIKPSKADIELTNALVEIGKMQGILIGDHIIMGRDKYFSFLDNGMIYNEKKKEKN